TELNSDIAGTFASQLATNTERASDMKEEELESAVELLSAVAVFSYTNLSIAKDMMHCVSNVLDVDAEVMARSTTEENTGGELLSIIKDFGENVVLENTTSIEFREANMQLQIVEPDPSDVTDGIVFEEDGDANETKTSISLPAEVFGGKEKTKHRVRFTSLQNGKLFLSKGGSEDNSGFDADNQMVISAELTGRQVSGLTQTVNYSIGIPQAGKKYKCAFWDETAGVWTTEGLQVVRYVDGNNSLECTSTHLTYFAVLLDTGFSNGVPPQHTLPLTLISYVGSVVSMLGLVATFLTYTLFRSLRKQPSGKLLVNLCASLFFLNLIFILDGTGAITGTDGGCKIAAISLHYFVLATFFWMGAEAVSIYRSLVEVFQGNRSSYYVCKCAIFAWGGALIPVGIVMAVDFNLYTRHPAADICILSQENTVVYYLLYLAPCTLVLFANMVVFVLVLRAVFACNKQVHHNSARLRRTQVGCALSITFLLGLTWLFGFFAISEATLPFQYIFCILNSMQGFFIFLFRCALYPEVVRSWRMCWKMRTLSVDRHINSSNAQKHSSHNNPDHSSSSSNSKKSNKSKQNTKVTFASSESNKTSFRWLRRSDGKDLTCINDVPCQERYRPTESYDEGRNNNALSIEYPFRSGVTEENNV
ncbi:putative G-protein coupled receptor, partial [Apostichopus japonicus]